MQNLADSSMRSPMSVIGTGTNGVSRLASSATMGDNDKDGSNIALTSQRPLEQLGSHTVLVQASGKEKQLQNRVCAVHLREVSHSYYTCDTDQDPSPCVCWFPAP